MCGDTVIFATFGVYLTHCRGWLPISVRSNSGCFDGQAFIAMQFEIDALVNDAHGDHLDGFLDDSCILTPRMPAAAG